MSTRFSCPSLYLLFCVLREQRRREKENKRDNGKIRENRTNAALLLRELAINKEI